MENQNVPTPVRRYFDSFGNITGEQHYNASSSSVTVGQSGYVDEAFAFTGRYFDKDAGQQNNLNRWYDPKTGRFISEDPIGFDAGDTNLYRYVRNQPTDLTDHTGLGFDHLQGRDDDSWWSWWTDFKRNFVHYANPFIDHHHVDWFDDFAEPAKPVVDVVVVVDVVILAPHLLLEAPEAPIFEPIEDPVVFEPIEDPLVDAGTLPEDGLTAPFNGGDPFDPHWIRFNPGSTGPGTIIGPQPPPPPPLPWPWWLVPPGSGFG